MKHVIIGAGAAGLTAAMTIKKIDKQAEVVVLGKEGFLPYKRFLLTEFLCGSLEQEELMELSLDTIKELGIEFRKGQSAKSINHLEKTIKLFHNEVICYDKLLIATGGKPSPGTVLKPYEELIQPYHSLQDILLLKQKLPGIEECVVFGNGLSNLDLLCGLRNLNKKVTYIVKGDRADFPLLEWDTPGDVHDFIEQKGVDMVTGDRVVSVEKKGDRYLVKTLKRKEFNTDLVFAWDQYNPNISIIEGTDIEKKMGILVNLHLETTVPDIYAAGDCVEIYHGGIKNYWINFGWPNALEQGEIAGKNMMGLKKEYKVHETIVFNLMGKSLTARWWE